MERTVSYQLLEADLDRANEERAELMARIKALEAKLDQVHAQPSLPLPSCFTPLLTSTPSCIRPICSVRAHPGILNVLASFFLNHLWRPGFHIIVLLKIFACGCPARYPGTITNWLLI